MTRKAKNHNSGNSTRFSCFFNINPELRSRTDPQPAIRLHRQSSPYRRCQRGMGACKHQDKWDPVTWNDILPYFGREVESRNPASVPVAASIPWETLKMRRNVPSKATRYRCQIKIPPTHIHWPSSAKLATFPPVKHHCRKAIAEVSHARGLSRGVISMFSRRTKKFAFFLEGSNSYAATFFTSYFYFFTREHFWVYQ